MNQEILNKLHTALYFVSPLASDRERIISEMGEVIWAETLQKMLLVLEERDRKKVIEFLNNNDLDKALEIVESKNIDIDTIITDVSTSLLDEVLITAK